jgi:RND family efflux transporter MFP subunit
VKNAHAAALLVFAGASLLGGCGDDSKTPPSQVPAAQVRPVLSTVAGRQASLLDAFAGTVEPRYKSAQSFRVLGRVIERNVNVGDTVKKDARLAALDPVPFDLAVKDARASLANATAQLANATAAEKRLRILRGQEHISSQQLEAVQQLREAAEAAVTRVRSALDKALEQRGYAELRAEFDGIVTSVDIEAGQVVTAGQPAITIARPDVREAVIDVPDDAAASLREGSPFQVALVSTPSKRIGGRVREIAPRVDALTHSQRVKIALSDPPEDFRLGTVITAYAQAHTTAHIEIPETAILEQNGKPQVWIVDPAAKTVSLREVNISGRDGKTAIVTAGIEPGDRVVTAGVHSLTPGQSVRIPEEAPK